MDDANCYKPSTLKKESYQEGLNYNRPNEYFKPFPMDFEGQSKGISEGDKSKSDNVNSHTEALTTQVRQKSDDGSSQIGRRLWNSVLNKVWRGRPRSVSSDRRMESENLLSGSNEICKTKKRYSEDLEEKASVDGVQNFHCLIKSEPPVKTSEFLPSILVGRDKVHSLPPSSSAKKWQQRLNEHKTFMESDTVPSFVAAMPRQLTRSEVFGHFISPESSPGPKRELRGPPLLHEKEEVGLGKNVRNWSGNGSYLKNYENSIDQDLAKTGNLYHIRSYEDNYRPHLNNAEGEGTGDKAFASSSTRLLLSTAEDIPLNFSRKSRRSNTLDDDSASPMRSPFGPFSEEPSYDNSMLGFHALLFEDPNSCRSIENRHFSKQDKISKGPKVAEEEEANDFSSKGETQTTNTLDPEDSPVDENKIPSSLHQQNDSAEKTRNRSLLCIETETEDADFIGKFIPQPESNDCLGGRRKQNKILDQESEGRGTPKSVEELCRSPTQRLDCKISESCIRTESLAPGLFSLVNRGFEFSEQVESVVPSMSPSPFSFPGKTVSGAESVETVDRRGSGHVTACNITERDKGLAEIHGHANTYSSDDDFLAETTGIAKEHLQGCASCAFGQLDPRQASPPPPAAALRWQQRASLAVAPFGVDESFDALHTFKKSERLVLGKPDSNLLGIAEQRTQIVQNVPVNCNSFCQAAQRPLKKIRNATHRNRLSLSCTVPNIAAEDIDETDSQSQANRIPPPSSRGLWREEGKLWQVPLATSILRTRNRRMETSCCNGETSKNDAVLKESFTVIDGQQIGGFHADDVKCVDQSYTDLGSEGKEIGENKDYCFHPKLVASSYDGTLWRSNGEVVQKSRAVVLDGSPSKMDDTSSVEASHHTSFHSMFSATCSSDVQTVVEAAAFSPYDKSAKKLQHAWRTHKMNNRLKDIKKMHHHAHVIQKKWRKYKKNNHAKSVSSFDSLFVERRQKLSELQGRREIQNKQNTPETPNRNSRGMSGLDRNSAATVDKLQNPGLWWTNYPYPTEHQTDADYEFHCRKGVISGLEKGTMKGDALEAVELDRQRAVGYPELAKLIPYRVNSACGNLDREQYVKGEARPFVYLRRKSVSVNTEASTANLSVVKCKQNTTINQTREKKTSTNGVGRPSTAPSARRSRCAKRSPKISGERKARLATSDLRFMGVESNMETTFLSGKESNKIQRHPINVEMATDNIKCTKATFGERTSYALNSSLVRGQTKAGKRATLNVTSCRKPSTAVKETQTETSTTLRQQFTNIPRAKTGHNIRQKKVNRPLVFTAEDAPLAFLRRYFDSLHSGFPSARTDSLTEPASPFVPPTISLNSSFLAEMPLFPTPKDFEKAVAHLEANFRKLMQD